MPIPKTPIIDVTGKRMRPKKKQGPVSIKKVKFNDFEVSSYSEAKEQLDDAYEYKLKKTYPSVTALKMKIEQYNGMVRGSFDEIVEVYLEDGDVIQT